MKKTIEVSAGDIAALRSLLKQLENGSQENPGDPFLLKNKYETKCKQCGASLPVGINVMYVPKEKAVYCQDHF